MRPVQHCVDDEWPEHHGHAILIGDRRHAQLHASLQDVLAAGGTKGRPVWRAEVEDGVEKADLEGQCVWAALATTSLVDEEAPFVKDVRRERAHGRV